MKRRIAFLLVVHLFAIGAAADEDLFESVRHDPLLLRRFLEQMPKGGDLHNHLSGTVYGESYIRWAAQDGLCIDTQKLAFAACGKGNTAHVPASKALHDPGLHTKILDAISMRQFREIDESGHDHFFATFGKFSAATRNRTSAMVTEVVSRFARENVDYVELLFGQDLGAARELGKTVKPGTSFEAMRDTLLKSGGVAKVVQQSRATIDGAEKHRHEHLKCGTADAQSGCDSTVRYLFETHRAFAREALFAELLVGFELATTDSRVVGLNVVQPEDWYAAMAGFDELMQMFAYLRPLYPNVRVSTHAGELAGGLVPPEGMQNHIRDSVMIAKADRIGHGVDIAREKDAIELLRHMADRDIAVEVCLTSNDVILGVTGRNHPLLLYMRSGVPVMLATDDAGVSRGDMTTEWQRAVEEHGVTYEELKWFARNSIEYSFLEGASLWRDRNYEEYAAPCEDDERSGECRSFLDANAKARVQMRLERRLEEFERGDLR